MTFLERLRLWIQRFFNSVLRCGPVPQHLAVIMDGNRRFAAQKRLVKSEGHERGANTLIQAMNWCRDIGIKEVTLYAFSVENFKRPKEEVDYLMELLERTFKAQWNTNKELNVRVRLIGDMALIPPSLQEVLAELSVQTAQNRRLTLNICIAYTAREDMCMAMREMATGVSDGSIRNSDISQSLLEKCLYTSHSRILDLLIRTSGEVRLSDFLLWESSFSCLAFVKVLWPEFTIWHLYAAILHYQRNCAKIQAARQCHFIERERLQRESDFRCVIEEFNMTGAPVNDGRTEGPTTDMTAASDDDGRTAGSTTHMSAKPEDSVTDTATGSTTFPTQQKSVQARVQKYAAERKKRVQTFLAQVYERRTEYIRSFLPVHPVMGSKPVIAPVTV